MGQRGWLIYFQYGQYKHAVGEVAFSSLRKEKLINDAGFLYGERQQWALEGFLQASNSAGVDAALAGLAGAYNVDFQNAAFYFDDGTLTNLFMPGTAKLGGVRVKSLELPEGKGAVYSSYLPYRIVLEGQFEVVGSALVKSWKETVTFSGGGPEFKFLEPITGKPQKQQTKESVTYKAVQSGQAVGVYDYPQVAEPLFPGAEHRNLREIVPTTPSVTWDLGRAQYYDFPISWTYHFEDADPLGTSKPKFWGGK